MNSCLCCVRIGGPRPCGCPGVGEHRGYCSKATDAQKAAYKEQVQELMAPIIKALQELSN